MTSPRDVIADTIAPWVGDEPDVFGQFVEPIINALDKAGWQIVARDEEDGAALIAAERQRQIETEGWTPEHDDRHDQHELAWAAACLAPPETIYRVRIDPERGVSWREPWPREYVPNLSRGRPGYQPWRRPECDRIRQLVKAGALIAAEIDRLQRVPVAPSVGSSGVS